MHSRAKRCFYTKNGKRFPVDQAKVGVNLPPMHPYCRSTTIAVIEDGIWEMSDEEIDKLMNEIDDELGLNEDIPFDDWLAGLKETEDGKVKYVGVDKSAGSGIIEVGNESMYRKKSDFRIEPMPKKQLHRIEKRFKALGGIIQYDEETDKYLKSKNAEAITYNSTTILIKRNAGRASVFEELIHTAQYRNGENDGTYISRLRCEIAAQKSSSCMQMLIN